ncbi:MAG: hypothetical protein DCF30_11785 [Hyphomicrobiales bacterium]|nr:MAG: hypothetical protein DCF30_11785 [Hyphomicrobiales bacterium]
MIDSPGGTARLVRANLVTGKRNFLRSYASATDFITMLTVVMPSDEHIPVRGVMWKFSTDAKIMWDQNDKPTLNAGGLCMHNGEVDPAMIRDDRLRMLRYNAFQPTDPILFKVNNGLTTAETLDAASGISTGSTADRRFNGGTFEIVHSAKLQL